MWALNPGFFPLPSLNIYCSIERNNSLYMDKDTKPN